MMGTLLRNLLAALIASSVPMGETPSDGEALYDLKGYPVVVRYEAGEAVHAGVDIFGERPSDRDLGRLMDFIERYSLQMLLLDTDRERELQMQVDGVSMPSFFNTPLHRDGPVALSLQQSETTRYEARWGHAGEPAREMSFPSDFQLITGMNKIELENGFLPALLASCPSVTMTPDSTGFDRIDRNLYKQGGESYLIPAITHTGYFQKKGGRYEPVLSAGYPVESLYNLLQNPEMEGEWTASLRVLKYGYQSDTADVPVSQLVRYCLSEGCVPFLGVESYDQDTGDIVLTLIMHNGALAYDHVAKVTANRSCLEAGGGTIQLTMSVFIPIHNIKNLLL